MNESERLFCCTTGWVGSGSKFRGLDWVELQKWTHVRQLHAKPDLLFTTLMRTDASTCKMAADRGLAEACAELHFRCAAHVTNANAQP